MNQLQKQEILANRHFQRTLTHKKGPTEAKTPRGVFDPVSKNSFTIERFYGILLWRRLRGKAEYQLAFSAGPKTMTSGLHDG